ncbi:MAG: sugar transferase [Firmicutes bacterium]|nr:sugar transferase [Bacillota bacterium]
MVADQMLNKDTAMPMVRRSFYTRYMKRLLDIVLSGFAIVVLSPVFVIVTFFELIFHGWPVLYVSQRPGKNGQIFHIYKFRSMTNKTDEHGELLPEEYRLTKFGSFLRRTSLDELPELWSIFAGKMSIIGPRPLLIEYLELYTPRHQMRHIVRPGLACVRVKKNKDDILSDSWTWREQFENDIYYIENISFLLDMKMIVQTVILAMKGSSYRTSDTRVQYNGKNLDETRSKQEFLSGFTSDRQRQTVNING